MAAIVASMVTTRSGVQGLCRQNAVHQGRWGFTRSRMKELMHQHFDIDNVNSFDVPRQYSAGAASFSDKAEKHSLCGLRKCSHLQCCTVTNVVRCRSLQHFVLLQKWYNAKRLCGLHSLPRKHSVRCLTSIHTPEETMVLPVDPKDPYNSLHSHPITWST